MFVDFVLLSHDRIMPGLLNIVIAVRSININNNIVLWFRCRNGFCMQFGLCSCTWEIVSSFPAFSIYAWTVVISTGSTNQQWGVKLKDFAAVLALTKVLMCRMIKRVIYKYKMWILTFISLNALAFTSAEGYVLPLASSNFSHLMHIDPG